MTNDPREIIARFKSVCAETGRVINKGDRCIYYPIGKKVFCMESKQAEDYRNWLFDINCLNANY
jgi:hypothetical protein